MARDDPFSDVADPFADVPDDPFADVGGDAEEPPGIFDRAWKAAKELPGKTWDAGAKLVGDIANAVKNPASALDPNNLASAMHGFQEVLGGSENVAPALAVAGMGEGVPGFGERAARQNTQLANARTAMMSDETRDLIRQASERSRAQSPVSSALSQGLGFAALAPAFGGSMPLRALTGGLYGAGHSWLKGGDPVEGAVGGAAFNAALPAAFEGAGKVAGATQRAAGRAGNRVLEGMARRALRAGEDFPEPEVFRNHKPLGTEAGGTIPRDGPRYAPIGDSGMGDLAESGMTAAIQGGGFPWMVARPAARGIRRMAGRIFENRPMLPAKEAPSSVLPPEPMAPPLGGITRFRSSDMSPPAWQERLMGEGYWREPQQAAQVQEGIPLAGRGEMIAPPDAPMPFKSTPWEETPSPDVSPFDVPAVAPDFHAASRLGAERPEIPGTEAFTWNFRSSPPEPPSAPGAPAGAHAAAEPPMQPPSPTMPAPVAAADDLPMRPPSAMPETPEVAAMRRSMLDDGVDPGEAEIAVQNFLAGGYGQNVKNPGRIGPFPSNRPKPPLRRGRWYADDEPISEQRNAFEDFLYEELPRRQGEELEAHRDSQSEVREEAIRKRIEDEGAKWLAERGIVDARELLQPTEQKVLGLIDGLGDSAKRNTVRTAIKDAGFKSDAKTYDDFIRRLWKLRIIDRATYRRLIDTENPKAKRDEPQGGE